MLGHVLVSSRVCWDDQTVFDNICTILANCVDAQPIVPQHRTNNVTRVNK